MLSLPRGTAPRGRRAARQTRYGDPVRVSASVGGVLGVRGHTTATAMLRDADAAMYAAKDRGAGMVQVFDDAASHRSLDRLDLRSQLLHALDRDELRLRYQPIVSLASGRVHGFEALLRWTHPRRGTVSPDDFIPLAEDAGAIVPIGQWVLREACRQLAAWKTALLAAGSVATPGPGAAGVSCAAGAAGVVTSPL